MAIKVNGQTVIYDDEVLRVGASSTEGRPTVPVVGMVRFNTTTDNFEGFNGNRWAGIGGEDEVTLTLALTAL